MFLSTPPSRVATEGFRNFWIGLWGFYPRHPRGWRLVTNACAIRFCAVSIHATLAGGDQPPMRHNRGRSRVSIHATLAGGDRFDISVWIKKWCVSIHATLAGGDVVPVTYTPIWLMFLSTPPSRVATRQQELAAQLQTTFLSTPPSRVATKTGC